MDVKELIGKVEKARKGLPDLSSDEDLSIAVMNLVSIEEHLYFTGMKTGKRSYFSLLGQVREMRKELLKRLVGSPEGEVWCISKHLLAATMRLIEVGNKSLGKNRQSEAMEMFDKAFELYSVFWGLNLGLIKQGSIPASEMKGMEVEYKEAGFGVTGRLSSIIKKIIDCCKE